MKIVFCIVFILLIGLFSKAQGLHYGLNGGFTASTIIEKSDVNSGINKTLKYGYQAGVCAEFDLLDVIYVGTAINFVSKGDKFKDQFAVSKANFGCFEVPVYFGYKIPLGNFYISANIGPYSSIAIVGKRSFNVDDDPQNEPPFEWNFEDTGHEAYIDNNTEFFGEEWNSYKRFDSGISAGLKLGYQQYQISATYSRGFVDIRPEETIKSNNSVLNVSFVYFIKY
ncbi:MAG: outer membrane beta-barrel protein [Bacteroidales bacterium]|nr:outer membrane beta-barrel protein [Bacteroidales bacterium]